MKTPRLAPALFVLFAGCNGGGLPYPLGDGGAADLAMPPNTPPPDFATPDLAVVTPTTTFSILNGQQGAEKVDLLFMVDNSYSMQAMSNELKQRFGQLFKVFGDLAARGIASDVHLGVVTSDYGAGAVGAPGCQPSPGGQRGILQAVGQAAKNTCQPPLGANFVRYIFGGANNLPPGQDLIQTFSCMASVGAGGCGFEHQLESVYAALHNNLPENQGFLRADALLAVVFLSNEDDSSAPPDTDIFDKNKVQQYGFESSYRQTRWGVMCNGILTPYGDSGGPLANCLPATDPPGKEYEVTRYINFFTQPAAQGGVKANPDRVLLVAIDAPAEPVQVILSNPGTPGGQPYVPCGQLNEGTDPPCVPVLQHSCQNPQQPEFFGDPAVRLNTVISAAAHHAISSICDNDYTGALASLGKLVGVQISGGCVPSALADPNHPQCVVTDLTLNQDGSTTKTAISQCDQGHALPCWHVDAKASCQGLSPDGVQLIVDRNGMALPPGTQTSATCVTK